MSGPFIDALASERAHNALLRWIIAGVLLLSAFGMYLTYGLPKHLALHLAPNIQPGDKIDVSNGQAPVPAQNVYAFGYYIWQQLNRWQTDGEKDYGKQLFNLQAYITPQCQAQLQGDMDGRAQKGELRLRTRYISEIPGQGFSANRVVPEGGNAWTVLLDMEVKEDYRGQTIKGVLIRYPVRVVTYKVDPERNPWGLGLDCFGANRPERLNADVTANRLPALPSTIAPAALPRTLESPETPSDKSAAPAATPSTQP